MNKTIQKKKINPVLLWLMWPLRVLVHSCKYLFNEKYRLKYIQDKTLQDCIRSLNKLALMQGQPIGSLVGIDKRPVRVVDWTVSLRHMRVKAVYEVTTLTRDQRAKLKRLTEGNDKKD